MSFRLTTSRRCQIWLVPVILGSVAGILYVVASRWPKTSPRDVVIDLASLKWVKSEATFLGDLSEEMIRRDVITNSAILAAAVSIFMAPESNPDVNLEDLKFVIQDARPPDAGRQLCDWLAKGADLRHAGDALYFMQYRPYPEVLDCIVSSLDDRRVYPDSPYRTQVCDQTYNVLMSCLKELAMAVPDDMPGLIDGEVREVSDPAIKRMKQYIADNRVEIRRKAEAWCASEVKRIEEQTKATRR